MSLVEKQLAVRDHIITALKTDLVGPFKSREILPTPPSRWYMTGFLVPKDASIEQKTDTEALDEFAKAGAEEGEEGDGGSGSSGLTPYFSSSMGMSFLVPQKVNHVYVSVRWGRYRRLSKEESDKWSQHERKVNREFLQKTSKLIEDLEVEDDKEAFGVYWQRCSDFEQSFRVPILKEGKIQIPSMNGVHTEEVYFEVCHAQYSEKSNDAHVVSLFLVNGIPPMDTKTSADESSIFQVGFSVECLEGFVPREFKNLSQQEDDLRNDLQYRDCCEWAVGHGISTIAHQQENGSVQRLETTWIPSAKVYRMKENSIDGVECSMRVLSNMKSASELAANMETLFATYQAWIDSSKNSASHMNPVRQETACSLMYKAEHAITRMKNGLRILEADQQAWTAFRLTNTVMADAAIQVRPEDNDPQWRLFQLAFLLLNIDGMTNPESVDRQVVDLLFFPTGGGKTEAYLGVSAYTLILRRIRYRNDNHQGLGVSVILRYTLRLLTIDQLERAATLISALELKRRERPQLLGDHRFSVGLWVGRAATPLYLSDMHEKLKDWRKKPNMHTPFPLHKCPWCGTPFTVDCFQIDIDNQGSKKVKKGLVVRCAKMGGFTDDSDLDAELEEPCPFSEERGIPVVVVDEQVYNELPSFLIGTVDKFALLPWREQAGMLFGNVSGFDHNRFYPPKKNGTQNFTRLHSALPTPDLIIQDELHLITGPLGTMVGLYETVIHELASRTQPPKIIASTATAKRAQHQIQALYARSSHALFPPQGINDGETFFASMDTTPQKSRQYLGVAAPGRSLRAIAEQVYTSLLSSSYHQYNKLKKTTQDGETNPADPYMTLVGYFNSLRELGGMQRIIQERIAIRTYRMNLRRSSDEEDNEWFMNRSIAFEPLELTSRKESNEITDTKAILDKPYDDDNRKGDIVLASSMISVGVDIPRLGLMVMCGQPRTVAEYIQSTSRVGRRHPGLVITMYNLFRPRDRSYYERFSAFHNSFYRFIESASVTPFSGRALERGLAGISVAMVRHGIKNMSDGFNAADIHSIPNEKKQIAQKIGLRAKNHCQGDEALAEQVSDAVSNLLHHWEDVRNEMSAKGQPLHYSPWEEGSKQTALLQSAVEDIPPEYPQLEKFRAPTSMRDVEPSVPIWVGFLGESK